WGRVQMGADRKSGKLWKNGENRNQTADKQAAREIQDLTRNKSGKGGNHSLTSVYIVCIIYT
ncbi:hypothetical protein, partial [Clostridioides difficile]|uniref:hypothetical protein n=1 Tax=Clostridioides difficile TaxID=1496 RepID=UPI001A9A5AA7